MTEKKPSYVSSHRETSDEEVRDVTRSSVREEGGRDEVESMR